MADTLRKWKKTEKEAGDNTTYAPRRQAWKAWGGEKHVEKKSSEPSWHDELSSHRDRDRAAADPYGGDARWLMDFFLEERDNAAKFDMNSGRSRSRGRKTPGLAMTVGAVVVGVAAVLLPVLATSKFGVASVGLCLAVLAALGAAVMLLKRSVHLLGRSEQLHVEYFTEVWVYNGPGIQILNPLSYRSAVRRPAEMLGTIDYLRLKDTVSGEERIVRGPMLYFLGSYERVMQRGSGTTLSKTEYLAVENQLTGESTIVKGPCVWFPAGPFERAAAPKTAVSLQEDEYLRLKDQATGQRWVQRGKALLFLDPTWRTEGSVQKAWTLKSFEYVRLLDSVTGKVTVHRGEKTVFPGPDESLLDGDKLTAIDLKVGEYVKVEDQNNGHIRVVAGADRVFLGPSERVLDGGKKKAVQVDEEHAVRVRDLSTGQLRLTTDQQLFVPGPHEAIEEVQQLIRLSDHEAMITKDRDGHLHFHYGSAERNGPEKLSAFFLPPYSEVVQLWWSSGLRRERRDLKIEVFDCRPQYMWFEFDCRTSDNVELVLEVTMFWEVADLPKLVRTTGNLPGDVYNQARSQFIKQVARVTLKTFMESLHSIANSVLQEDIAFYENRGISINAMEVTRYKCTEHRTSEVLQQIIEETTNRLNRLSKAESENEVNLFRMQGEIEQEKLNEELLEIQHRHSTAEARVQGAAEAERAAAFMHGLEATVPSHEDRMAMWQVLRKTDALTVVSGGGAKLYYTPKDVDLSIKTGE